MSDKLKLALCVATLFQIPALLILVVLDPIPTPFLWLVLVDWWGLWIFYFLHIRRNERVLLPSERKWRWAMFFFPWIAEPIYFFRYIWKDDQ